MKYEWRKLEKELYLPKKPTVIEVPTHQFISLSGSGDPNRPEFSEEIARFIYDFLFTQDGVLKKGGLLAMNPLNTRSFPLEGCVDLSDKARRCRQQRKN